MATTSVARGWDRIGTGRSETARSCGASMAGLLAARVLTDSYAQVTVIKRDELPETPMHRRGVPHGRHIHALAGRGQQILEEQVRAPVRAYENMQFLDGYDVVGLGASPDGRRVIGARVLRRAGGRAEELVGADLVVDASGRGSRIPARRARSACQRRCWAVPGRNVATRICRFVQPPDGRLEVQ